MSRFLLSAYYYNYTGVIFNAGFKKKSNYFDFLINSHSNGKNLKKNNMDEYRMDGAYYGWTISGKHRPGLKNKFRPRRLPYNPFKVI